MQKPSKALPIDITQRIAEALNRTEPAVMRVEHRMKTTGDKVIGQLCPHLRHCYNLIEETRRESSSPELVRALETIFQQALNEYFSEDLINMGPTDKFRGYKITPSWDVVTYEQVCDVILGCPILN